MAFALGERAVEAFLYHAQSATALGAFLAPIFEGTRAIPLPLLLWFVASLRLYIPPDGGLLPS